MDRRDFLIGTALLTTSSAPAYDWDTVRREFRLDPKLVNLGLFYLASNPREVRAEVDRVKRVLDANSHDFPPDLSSRPRAALASYIGGAPNDIALVSNTTTGLGLVYQGLRLRADQEVLVNDQDHFWHQEAARLACDRVGARLRVGTLFASPATATPAEIASRLRDSLTPATRAVGITWVQSSTGLRMPVREVASVIAEANRDRAPADRCLLIVDGVHGLAAVDDSPASMGADVFVAGTHKWLFGPRGTGMVWVNPAVVSEIRQVLPGADRTTPTTYLSPGGFHAFEHTYAVHAAVAFHQRLGRSRVAARITELSTRFKDGLAGLRGITIHTPRDPAMSAGITCFDVDGVPGSRVVEHLAAQRIQITTAAYRIPYARVGTSVLNTPEEVDRAVRAVASVPR
ncbi:class V aminotransferase [Lentzea sp. NBRC 105346]|uniref:aminotransferase class V-fold PLP-dependent enzyme n=1 Tax=Lentzea sp. NBRC 105346 TaxID=3032205 RepID=UPI0024A3D9D1|nr:aminotransferase class V-fold PLP-dependent enzyme [Lentzea sp. NBRC 105346]GLZ29505.1 class V aminotransferase [Lentzea sp. NBRC 105346]